MRALLVIVLIAGASLAQADEWRYGGHIKYQFSRGMYQSDDVTAVYADRTPADHEFDLRLKAENRHGPWETVVHYEMLGLYGDTLAARSVLAAAGLPPAGGITGLPEDDRRLFDLSRIHSAGDRYAVAQRLDRLSLAWLGEAGLVRVGRQAVSWGNGLVFHPMDMLNPFSPVAVDKEYKTGDDMLFAQGVVAGKRDIQAIVLPRRDPLDGRVKNEQGSAGLKYHHNALSLDMDLLLARHYDENLAGIGLVRSLGGAIGRLDVTYAGLAGGGHATSLVVNMDYSWTAFGKNVYGYAEYFHSGLGARDRAAYVTPSSALAERLARGELYTLGRDYLAAGLQAELTPLVHLYCGLIQNLHDGSGFAQLRATWDWQQNLQLMAGASFPYGERGSEYGGVPLTPTGPYSAAPVTAYLRGGYYF